MSVEVGMKVFDDEAPGLFGIIWSVRLSLHGLKCQVRWSDGSVETFYLDMMNVFGISAEANP